MEQQFGGSRFCDFLTLPYHASRAKSKYVGETFWTPESTAWRTGGFYKHLDAGAENFSEMDAIIQIPSTRTPCSGEPGVITLLYCEIGGVFRHSGGGQEVYKKN